MTLLDPCQPPERINILGVGVSAINMQQTLDQMVCWIANRVRTYIIVCPVYTVMRAQEETDLGQIVNQAGLVTPDGMPLVFLSRWRGQKQVDRVYGPDLLLAFSELSAREGYSNYYYGGASGIAPQLADNLRARYPGLPVAGTYTPPFRDLSPQEEDEVASRVNQANPDVVWVGLGSLKQEYWMGHFRQRLDAPILIGVGAAFDYITGRIPQAPRWMQNMSLEWLFRLMVEPARLWRRYLLYNPRFVWNVFLQETRLKHWTLDES